MLTMTFRYSRGKPYACPAAMTVATVVCLAQSAATPLATMSGSSGNGGMAVAWLLNLACGVVWHVQFNKTAQYEYEFGRSSTS